MSEHSKLPPSSAARRMACPGSRRMEAIYPRESSDASNEGTLAHEEAARLLKLEFPGNGVIAVINKPEDEFIRRYTDFVGDCFIKAMFDVNDKLIGKLNIEERVDISSIHPDCWGTPDAWFRTERNLHIFDFKYGFKAVEVYQNYQLLEYAAGIVTDEKFIHFHIVQPRAVHKDGAIRTWRIGRGTFDEYVTKLKISEALSSTEDALLTPGSGCEYCSARHACPVLRKEVLKPMKELPEELTDEELGIELKHLHETQELLKARLTGLEEEALTKLKLGKRIPFYQLGRSQPREKWIKPIEEVLILGDMFEVNLKKPAEAITPKQAIKAGVPADVVREYSETPLGELKLEQIKESETKRIFNHEI